MSPSPIDNIQQHFDVVIVGGGLAGLSMAASLCQLPLSIAIVEATDQPLDQSPSFDDRALALSYGSLKILRTLGILENGHSENFEQKKHSFKQTPIETIHVSDRGHSGFLRMRHHDVDLDCLGAVVAAKDLGAEMIKVVSQKEQFAAEITTFKPVRVESIQHLKNHARLKFVDAINDANKKTVTAEMVILADGGRSALNKNLGISTQKKEYYQVGILANLRASKTHQNTAYERFTQHGPIALLPLRENDYKLVWTVRPEDKERILALSDDRFLQAIQQEFGDRAGEFERVGKRVSYPMMESKAAQMTLGRVALIGNSAHTLHPIAGQGFNLGLRDVACLAELIADALKTGRDIADADLMAQYAAERQSDISRTAKFTDGLVRLFSNGILPLALLRNFGLFAIDRSPVLKKEIMHKMMGLAGKNGKLMQGKALTFEETAHVNSSVS